MAPLIIQTQTGADQTSSQKLMMTAAVCLTATLLNHGSGLKHQAITTLQYTITKLPSNDTWMINCINKNGAMTGQYVDSNNDEQSAYWPSPTSAAIRLTNFPPGDNPSMYPSSCLTSEWINDNGEIVGGSYQWNKTLQSYVDRSYYAQTTGAAVQPGWISSNNLLEQITYLAVNNSGNIVGFIGDRDDNSGFQNGQTADNAFDSTMGGCWPSRIDTNSDVLLEGAPNSEFGTLDDWRLYQHSTGQLLGGNPGNTSVYTALSLNDNMVVGGCHSNSAGYDIAFEWTPGPTAKGTYKDLALCSQDRSASRYSVRGISNSGIIVGDFTPYPTFRNPPLPPSDYFYKDPTPDVRDAILVWTSPTVSLAATLDSLLTNGTGWHCIQTQAYNPVTGVIIGTGTLNGTLTQFEAVPNKA